MKQKNQLQKYIAAASLAVALTFSPGLARAAQDVLLMPTGIQLNGDVNDTSIGNWGTFWITTSTNATCTFEFDPTMQSDPSIPGSIHCICDWTGQTDINFGAVLPNGNGTWLGNPSINVINGTEYTDLLMDIYWTNVVGLTSWANIGLMTPGYGMVMLTNNFPIPSSPAGWQHLVIPIDPSLANLDSIAGVMLYRWQDDFSLTHAEFWIDNVQLIARVVPVAPPALLSPVPNPVPGLAFIAASGGQYDRQEIRTVGSNYTWVGASGPVSYSMDVAKIGETNPDGFQLFVHFVPGIPNPTDGGSDYAETNVMMWRIMSVADGSAWSDLRYKTNAPASNGNMWDTGAFPGGVGNSTPVGTWTITFNQNTNIIITAPGGASVTNNLPTEVLDIFNAYPNMQLNFGAVPGELNRLGQMAVVTRVKITGTPGEPNVDSDFLAQPPDTNVWTIIAGSPTYGVQQIPTNAAYWLSWTLPANGFSLQTKATLGSGTWTDSALTGYEVAGFHYSLVKESDLPGINSGYFRLIKRGASQLQVLLPGETNAPGTTTGKIGTPDPQTVGNPFDFTVNACDSSWRIVTTCTDTVHITSNDTTAYLPADAALVKGTVTFSSFSNPFWFSTSGTWTITASDVTTNAVANGTSTPITIP